MNIFIYIYIYIYTNICSNVIINIFLLIIILLLFYYYLFSGFAHAADPLLIRMAPSWGVRRPFWLNLEASRSYLGSKLGI